MNIPSLFNNLSTKLSLLKEKLAIENSTNSFDINLHLENVYIKILNEVYDLNLINANSISLNYPGIDAIDKERGIGVQITSTFSKEKILNTIKQCIENKLYKEFNHLQFLFLKDVKRLNSATVNQINRACENKIELNLDDDLLDSNSIYQKLYYENNIIKLNKVITLLDEFLGTLPLDKTSSFASIAISFDDDESENAFNLIDVILRQGINVYIESESVYKRFENNSHRFFDYLVLIKNVKSIEHIKNYIIIISRAYIKNNLVDDMKSRLLETLIINDNASKVISFDPYLNNINDIKRKGFKKPYTAPIEKVKLLVFINGLIEEFNSRLKDQENNFIDADAAVEELISLNHQFLFIILEDSVQNKIIRFFMEGMEVEIVYIILKNNYVLKSVIEKVKSFEGILSNINILVPKKPGNKTRKQIDNLITRTDIKNTFYIDEFFFDKSLNVFQQTELLNISDFIDPVILKKDNFVHLNDLLNWIIDEKFPPIGILKASGGVGKTTLAEKIHDELIKDEENKFLVLFIDSNSFIENFKLNSTEEEMGYDLYNIYKNCHPQGDKIDKNKFNHNYYNGNILMIIDGVDEVVSTISSFSLDSFLKRLVQLNTKIGKGKILLTCRDAYVQDIEAFFKEDNSPIAEFELLPFNEKLARDYFSKNNLSDRKIEKSISLLNSLLSHNKSKEYRFPPFVLEVVLHFITKENKDTEDYKASLFNSEFLLEKHPIDFIIHQIFHREKLKKEEYGFDLSVDQQTAFFSLMTIERNGIIDVKDIPSLLSKTGHIARLEEASKALIDHPFLKKKNDKLYFNFKFLKGEFYIVALYSVLKEHGPVKINDFTIQVLANKCNYESIIIKGLLEKIDLDPYFDEEIVFTKIINLIDVIKHDSYQDIDKMKAISNLFLVLCQYCISKKIRFDKEYLTTIKRVFSNNNDEFIHNLYLIDIPEDMNLKLDFSGLYIEYSYIKNFNDFFNSKFNRDTYFLNTCLITNLTLPKKIDYEDISMTEENFHNIQGDNSIHKILKNKEQGIYTIENDIRKFLKCFYNGKQLNYKITKSRVRKKFNLRDIDVKIINALLEVKVLDDSSNGTYTLNQLFSRKVNKFVNQGIPFSEVKKTFDIVLRSN